MKRSKPWPAAILLGAAIAASPGALAKDLETLADWMIGSYSSAAQAEGDEDYYDIRLEMVRIWPSREDGVWLYVEQAVATALDRPYRQRVYHLSGPRDGVFSSDVYTIPDPLRFAGVWREEDPLAELSPDDLEARTGCTVFLRWNGEFFEGGTRGNGCASDLRGASYARSEVRAYPDRLETWDRGFDADGNQMWGAENAGYVFRRVHRDD